MANYYNYNAGNVKVGNRLAELRVKNGMKQSDLANKLTEITRRNAPLTVAAISAWETGRRKLSGEFVEYLADLYQVSQAYLLGLTDNPNEEEPEKTDTSALEGTNNVISKKVDPANLFLFDKKPVYVTFKDKEHNDQWGIYDAKTERFIMADFTLEASADVIDEIYSFAPFVISTKAGCIQSMDILLKSKSIFVKMKTTDQEVQRIYNGWYSHNENNTMLINNLGLTLPYVGLNISYYAYSF